MVMAQQGGITPPGELLKLLFMVMLPLIGKKMVVVDVGNDAGIFVKPVIESVAAPVEHRVVIGVLVYGPVKHDSSDHLRREMPYLVPFDMIGYEIAYQQVLVIAGQICMCKEVHRLKKCCKIFKNILLLLPCKVIPNTNEYFLTYAETDVIGG